MLGQSAGWFREGTRQPPALGEGLVVAVFLSASINRVDKKGRCSVPAAYRTAIERSAQDKILYVYPALNAPCLEGGDQAYFERLMDAIYEGSPALDDEPKRMARRILGRAEPLQWDGDGRIVLSQSLRDAAGIIDQAEFVGMGRSLQIWNPETLASFDDQADDSFTDTVKKMAPMRVPGLSGGSS